MLKNQRLQNFFSSRASIFAIIAFGVLILISMGLLKSGPQHQLTDYPTRVVNTLVVEQLTLVPRAIAYGSVEPDISWQASAEVSGRVVAIHPDLKAGATLAADTLVLQIDDVDYQLALTQAKAELASSQASLDELAVDETNTQALYAIVKRKLEVAETELERKKRLIKKGSISQTQLDAEEQKVLAQRQELQSLQSSLETFSSRREVLKASLVLAQTRVQEQQRNLNRTQIRLPFAARINTVTTEKDQYVARGGPLFEAHGMQKVEISAQIPMSKMRALVKALQRPQSEQALPLDREFIKHLGFSAVVRWGDDLSVEWPATVVRMAESLDPKTRSQAVVVAIDKPFEKVIPGMRPPLFKGMYMEVELKAPERQLLVIPRSALHRNQVYICDAENRLSKRDVVIDFVQGDLAIIRSGLSVGDRLIIDDLVPAIDGMPLAPRKDPSMEQRVRDLAAARLPLKGA